MIDIAMTDLTILYEDAEALVIDKPAGLPLDRPRAGGVSLEERIWELRLGFARSPSPVHRLDQDTSGCLLLARHPRALKRYAAAFEARTVGKRYWGVVAGAIADDRGTIELNLSKISSERDGWRMIPARAGKAAVTHWRVLDRRDGLTLVEFTPETGRTHQIRVHAASGLGHALLGDPVYGRKLPGKRTMLHAARLEIPRDGKPPIIAEAPMPADFLALGFAEPAR
jgi:tRNA pseudouridine32 synthase/23S rRNA pseudouridine746 synthase